MKNISRFSGIGLLLVASVILGACSDGKSGNQDVLAQDTTLMRDLALANQDTASQPQLKDVPVAAEPAPVETARGPEPEPAPPPRVQRRAASTRRAESSRDVARPPPQAVRRTRPRAAEPAPEPDAGTMTETGNRVTVGAPGSERAHGIVSVGSEMTLASGQRICTNTNSVGDRFTAQLADPVMGANGAVIPAGSSVVVAVTSLRRSNGAGDNIEIGLRVESVTFGGRTYPVSSEVTHAQVDRVRSESRGDDARKVATGAAIGAVLGQILGRKTKSTVIGAATGAAAGAVVASRNANYDGCVPNGGRITVRLTQPLTIQVT